MADYKKYSKKSDPSFAWADAQKRGKKAAKKTSRQKAINAIVDKYMPGLKMYGVAVNLSPEEQRAMNKELKRYGTTYNEIVMGGTKSRATSPKRLRVMGEKQAERRAAARKAGAPRMSLEQLRKAMQAELLPPPHMSASKKVAGRMTTAQMLDDMASYQLGAAPESFRQLPRNPKYLETIGSLYDIDRDEGLRLRSHDIAYDKVNEADFRSKQAMKGTQRGMAQKLLKGGGSIRLPQLRGGLPMMLLALLAGGLGMGMGSDGNEEIDALLG